MAVVIQEMVACQVSGVMFTCDPVSNNPNSITITANYGLGETVVSGSVEPDTFVLKKNGDDDPTIEELTIGSKFQKEVMDGAVVSREYGLPCVVGVRRATKQFKTGDYILIDGKKGILQRLPQPNGLEDKEADETVS
ncbi:phosphoenolpyruvate synthase-like [Parasteatoda tepidariorum]|uniref:phosphoenolpyruvate synthase-like n=1 Tax=Parasteatoda tepidariorum TaxID=114398 RepID=UPI001C720003|nr:uncharacterized phosphotransferase YvkC-like [Parasteatoda tepidariorum]